MDSPEIVAPAGNLASLKAAIESGADVVYAGFNDSTNARNFEGLNFTQADFEDGVEYVRRKGKKIYIAVNTFPQMDDSSIWQGAVDRAASLCVDAVILADMSLLDYASSTYPDLNLHLSVQASASNFESINFYRNEFGIKRVVLPRVLTIDEIKRLHEQTDVELEVFALGGLCINIEGRCYLSSYVTGASTNTEGVCSPSRFVQFTNDDDGALAISLNGVTLNRLAPDESAPYPTCCKGRYRLPDGSVAYAFEDPESLNVLEILPGLIDAGVSALKIEGRQRTKSYVAATVGLLREAIDAYGDNPESYRVSVEWKETALRNFEGSSETVGCYEG
ncbi:MAG: peptidase U32 family protein, partial [Thermodesulfobacteriota bacterium]